MPNITSGFFGARERAAFRLFCPRVTTRRSFAVSTFCERGMNMRLSLHASAGHSSKLTGKDGYRGEDQNDDQAASFSPHAIPSSPHSQVLVSLACTALTWKCR